jgi:hypothetical protein
MLENILLNAAEKIPLVAIFVYAILKMRQDNTKERTAIRDRILKSDKENAIERMDVQKNFREYVEMHTKTNATAQEKVADALIILAEKFHTSAGRTLIEHEELLAWIRQRPHKPHINE